MCKIWRIVQWSTFSFALLFSWATFAQSQQQQKPKLVIGIVVDQMRFDYLSRFYNKFSSFGFKRLLNEGYNCAFTHINYLQPLTAPGHASIFTGSVPAIHGIIGNDWYDKHTLLNTYCVEDLTVSTIGSSSRAGQMSPRNLAVTTIGDELKLNSNKLSKVIGVSLKDRGAILAAGHMADGAYFFDDLSHNFITSSYYMNQLPNWVRDFNQRIGETYLADSKWIPTFPLSNYTESENDSSKYEGKSKGESLPVFPHTFSNPVSALRSSPLGNKLVLDFAKQTIISEGLGSSSNTDLLTISLSSPDYIGHQYGPRSIEVEDCYIKLDLELSEFLNFLDSRLGKKSYVLFLTADHGVAENAQFSEDQNMPGGLVELQTSIKNIENSLKSSFGDFNWIKSFISPMFYINEKTLSSTNFDKQIIKKRIKDSIENIDGVYKVVDIENIDKELLDENLKKSIINGIYPKFAGDLYVLFKSGWYEGSSRTGSTHSSWFNYDRHIPLIWFGKSIPHDQDVSQIEITDIAPTIAALLHIQEPSGSIGKPIEGILKK